MFLPPQFTSIHLNSPHLVSSNTHVQGQLHTENNVMKIHLKFTSIYLNLPQNHKTRDRDAKLNLIITGSDREVNKNKF